MMINIHKNYFSIALGNMQARGHSYPGDLGLDVWVYSSKGLNRAALRWREIAIDLNKAGFSVRTYSPLKALTLQIGRSIQQRFFHTAGTSIAALSLKGKWQVSGKFRHVTYKED